MRISFYVNVFLLVANEIASVANFEACPNHSMLHCSLIMLTVSSNIGFRSFIVILLFVAFN